MVINFENSRECECTVISYVLYLIVVKHHSYLQLDAIKTENRSQLKTSKMTRRYYFIPGGSRDEWGIRPKFPIRFVVTTRVQIKVYIM